MQTVLPEANDDYIVPPLRTVATTIVSRSKTLIPVDATGIYGHPGRSQQTLLSTLRFTFGNNDAGALTENFAIIMDFTPQWFDQNVMFVTSAGDLPSQFYPKLTPNFDQSQHALIRNIRLRLPNGTILEEFQNYNEWVNISDANLQNAHRKERNLLNYSSFSKNLKKDRGMNPALDAQWDKVLSTNSIAHGQTRRLIIPFTHSAFLNKMRFLPLFLLRNGFQIEIDLEDPNLAFCWDSLSDAPKGWAYKAVDDNFQALQTLVAQKFNWFVGLGSIFNNATATPVGTYLGAGLLSAPNAPSLPPLFTLFAGAGITGGWPGGDVAQIGNFGGWSFKRFKNTLYVKPEIFLRMVNDSINANTAQSPEQLRLALPSGTLTLFPLRIYRRGHLVWRGFTLVDPYLLGSTNEITGYYPKNFVSEVIVPGPIGAQVFTAQPGSYTTYVNMSAAAQAAPFNYLRPPQAYDGAGSSFSPINGGNGDANYSPNQVAFCTLPMYNWDHFDSVLNGGAPGDNCIPFAPFNAQGDWFPFMQNFENMECELVIDFDNKMNINIAAAVVFPSGTAAAPSINYGPSIQQADPRATLFWWWANKALNPINMSYTLANIQLYVDWIKPSADAVSRYITAFSAPTGIPYAYPRVFRIPKQITFPNTGVQQIVLNASYRSTLGVVMVLTDNFSTINGYGFGNTVNFFPSLSSFQRRGLSRVELQIGGTRKPEYILQLDANQGVEHVPEMGNTLGFSVNSSVDPSYDRMSLGPTRNYAVAGNFNYAAATLEGFLSNSNNPINGNTGWTARSYGYEYSDSSKFILAISTAKKDTGNFACGTDTSNSGQLIANLYFGVDAAPTKQGDSFDPGTNLQRPINIVFYVIANAVGTFQNSSTTVRL